MSVYQSYGRPDVAQAGKGEELANLFNAITLEVARNEMLVLRPMTRQAVVDALNPAARAVLKRLRKRADRLRRA